MSDSTLHRKLATLCMKIDAAPDDETRNQLADEAELLCLALGIEIPDRALLGKPFIPGQTEIAP